MTVTIHSSWARDRGRAQRRGADRRARGAYQRGASTCATSPGCLRSPGAAGPRRRRYRRHRHRRRRRRGDRRIGRPGLARERHEHVPRRTDEVLPGRCAASWRVGALGFVPQVLRVRPSRGAGGEQVVHHPRWPLHVDAGGLRRNGERPARERRLARLGASKPTRTQRHHRWGHPASRSPPSRRHQWYGHQGR